MVVINRWISNEGGCCEKLDLVCYDVESMDHNICMQGGKLAVVR